MAPRIVAWRLEVCVRSLGRPVIRKIDKSQRHVPGLSPVVWDIHKVIATRPEPVQDLHKACSRQLVGQTPQNDGRRFIRQDLSINAVLVE